MSDCEVQVGNRPSDAGNEMKVKETREWKSRCRCKINI